MASCTGSASFSRRPSSISEDAPARSGLGLEIEWLGTVPYAEALEIQHQVAAARRTGARGDTLLLLEHPPVITFGRSGRTEHLLLDDAELARRGIELHHVARGGDVTWHAPGQLVGYPIVDLAAGGPPDLARFLRGLEASLVDALAGLGIQATRHAGFTGVYVVGSQPWRKIASIGIGVRGWVTCHGFALNVDLDPTGFETIVPCGLHEVQMTSVARELGDAAPDPLGSRTREAVSNAFRKHHADLVRIS
jgi:lipoate-protein ligase B